MSIVERKVREREEMRKLIMAKSLELFLEEGIENVTIRRIAEKIEYSPATVYLYFKDKGEIINALHVEGFEKLYSMQVSLNSISDPIERLRQQGRVYIKFALENPGYYDLMFIAKSIAEDISETNLWDVGERSYQYLRDNVQDCINHGYFGNTNIDAASFAMWSIVHGMVSLMIRKRCLMMPQDKMEYIINEGMEFIFKGILLQK